MKKILPLLLACLLLLGCSQKSGLSGVPAASEVSAPAPQAAGLYDQGHYLEQETGGAVTCYPLDTEEDTGIYLMGQLLLVMREDTDGTLMEVYSGDTLQLEAALDTPLHDFLREPSLRIFDTGISYYDRQQEESVLLDTQLRVVRQVAAPEGLVGVPLLSDDGKTLFYCTASAVRALDTDSGLSRVLKEIAVQEVSASALIMDGRVMQCEMKDGDTVKTVFISTENGQLLGQLPQTAQVETYGGSFYASFLDGTGWGALEILSYGQSESGAKLMDLPGSASFLNFLPRREGAVAWQYRQEPGGLEISLYALSSGKRVSALSLPQYIQPLQAASRPDGKIYLLLRGASEKGDVLCLWNPEKTAVEDPRNYTAPYSSPDAPDNEAMEACREYARDLSQQTGVTILVGEDAAAYQPRDYRIQAEYLATVTQRELELLGQHLSNFPDGFLATLAGNFDGLNLCLVRSASGSAGTGSLDAAAGLQYWDGATVYIALCTVEDTEYSLYHELCHLIDTQVMNNSSAYDTWEKFNPSDFSYDNDYIQNRSRDGSKYLTPGSEAFIDTYSMSFPKEDRARILEYAMTSGHEALFQSSILQSKLKQICIGIREGFGLTDSPERYLWEQYLWSPLAGE